MESYKTFTSDEPIDTFSTEPSYRLKALSVISILLSSALPSVSLLPANVVLTVPPSFMVTPLAFITTWSSVLAPFNVTAPLANKILSTLFSLIVIPLSLIVTLSVEVPITDVAPKVARVVSVPELSVIKSIESLSISTLDSLLASIPILIVSP